MTDDERVYSLISAERRALVDTLETLTEEQWATPSLCDGWTVRHVAGHLASILDQSKLSWVLAIARKAGRFDSAANGFADQYAQKPTAAIVGILRRNAEKRYHPPGFPVQAPLVDVVVHSVDIALPLGLPTQRSTAAGQVAVEYLTSKSGGRFQRSVGYRNLAADLLFVPTDGAWPDGPLDEGRGFGDPSHPAVRGTGALLAAALSGRHQVLDQLSGEGVDTLRSRLGA